jgi:hypothetical protein
LSGCAGTQTIPPFTYTKRSSLHYKYGPHDVQTQGDQSHLTNPFAWWVPVPFLATRFSGEAKKKSCLVTVVKGRRTEGGRNNSSIHTTVTKMILGHRTSTLYRRCPNILVISSNAPTKISIIYIHKGGGVEGDRSFIWSVPTCMLECHHELSLMDEWADRRFSFALTQYEHYPISLPYPYQGVFPQGGPS